MRRSYLSLLDLMMGFTGVMLILLAISNQGVGEGEVEEKWEYFLLEIRVEGTNPEPWTEMPSKPLFEVDGAGDRVTAPVCRRGPKAFSFLLYGTTRPSETTRADRRSGKIPLGVVVRAPSLSGLRPIGSRFYGELRPQGAEQPADPNLKAWFDGLAVNLAGCTNGFEVRFQIADQPGR